MFRHLGCVTLFVSLVLTVRGDLVAKRSIDLDTALAHVDELPLPRLVTVNGYHLELQPLIEEGKFKGRVKINITCKEPTSTITVHADPKLRIVSKPPSEISVREISEDGVLSNQTCQVIGTRRDLERQWFTINLAEDLKKSAKYQVELRFAGDLVTEKTESFFRKSYVDAVTGDKKWYVAINMGPTNSRRIFPCFDEPMLKVPIQLSVVRPEHMVALSVMPVKTSRNSSSEPGWVWDTFQTSPVMSTFSLSLLVSDLPQLSIMKISDSVNIRFFGRESFKPELIRAMNVLPKFVEFAEEYFGVDFPLLELNIVALPQYMGAPANHWGLIMFSETTFTAEDEGLWVMGRELMMQWIGHLVTPHWWNDLRVASALSQFVTVACMRQTVCPKSWAPSDMYYIYYSYSQPHPFAGRSQEYIRKSSNVWFLRMLNFTLGEKTFKAGLQNFVKDRKHETFYEDDIWGALTEQAHLNETLDPNMRVETISRSWMSEDRFPVVSVKRNYKQNTAHLEQHIFLRTRPQEGIDKKRVTWWIPIITLTPDTNTTVDDLRPLAWMRGESEIDIDDLPSEEEFIIVNPDEIGMFMVNYDERNWELLSYKLIDGGHGEVAPLDPGVRAKLLHDAWNLAYGGELSFATALNMTMFLEFENDYHVWKVMLNMIDHVSQSIECTEVMDKFKEYFRRLIVPFYEKLGPKEDDEPTIKEQVRGSVEHFLCAINYKPCIEKDMAVFDNWMQETDPDAGNPMSHSAMCHVLKWGTMEQWKFAHQRLVNLPSNRTQAERSDMIRALAGCPNQPEKIELFLNVSILEGNGNYTESDVRLALNMLTAHSVAYTTLFNFLVNNWDAVKQRCEGKPHMWEFIMNVAVGSFKTQDGLEKINELYADRKGQFGTAEQIVLEKLKKVIEEAKWSNKAIPVMEVWLDDRLTQETKV